MESPADYMARVILKEIREDPQGSLDRLAETIRESVVRDHGNDMLIALSLLYLLTKEQPEHPKHQLVLDLMKKYKVPPPPDVSVTPGRA